MNFLQSISTRNWIIIAVVILVIILLIYFATRKKTVTTTTTVTQPAVTVPISTGNNFPLQNGSRGDNVKKWQTYLNTKGATLTVDGIWGPLTEAASIKYTGYNSVTETYFKGLGI